MKHEIHSKHVCSPRSDQLHERGVTNLEKLEVALSGLDLGGEELETALRRGGGETRRRRRHDRNREERVRSAARKAIREDSLLARIIDGLDRE